MQQCLCLEAWAGSQGSSSFQLLRVEIRWRIGDNYESSWHRLHSHWRRQLNMLPDLRGNACGNGTRGDHSGGGPYSCAASTPASVIDQIATRFTPAAKQVQRGHGAAGVVSWYGGHLGNFLAYYHWPDRRWPGDGKHRAYFAEVAFDHQGSMLVATSCTLPSARSLARHSLRLCRVGDCTPGSSKMPAAAGW